jgi:hypothetical protein
MNALLTSVVLRSIDVGTATSLFQRFENFISRRFPRELLSLLYPFFAHLTLELSITED